MAQESSQVPALPANMGVAGMEMAWAHSAIYTRMVRDARRAVSGHELASRTTRSLDNIRQLESRMQDLLGRLQAQRGHGAAAAAAHPAQPAQPEAATAPAASASETPARPARPVLEPLHPATALAIRHAQEGNGNRRASEPSHQSTRGLVAPVASGSGAGVKRRRSGGGPLTGPAFKRGKRKQSE